MRLIAIATLAAAGSFALTSAQAATFMTPSTKIASASVIEQVAKKAKAGSCGTYMYYNKKTKKCADARLKK
jgi:uncharacterized low-complexity protein